MNLVPQARNFIKSLPQIPKRNFADVFIGANPLGECHVHATISSLCPSSGEIKLQPWLPQYLCIY